MQTAVSVFGVNPSRIGGTETFARELSRQLEERHTQSVLCFLEEPGEHVRAFLQLSNVAIETVPHSTHFNLGAAAKLARIIRRYSPEVLHLHFTGFIGPYVWLARLLGVKKIFFTDHSSRPADHHLRRAPLWKQGLTRAINWPLTKVICVSEYGFRCLTSLALLAKDRFALVYNAVDRSRVSSNARSAVEFRRRYHIPANCLVVLQVSWMIPEKGIQTLLKAAQLLLSRNNKAHFVLVGEGKYRKQFMDEAVHLGIADHVSWTGLIEDPIAAGVYEVADIVCQLSQWEELFGWMIAEGMAHGKPIVATRVGGIPELVTDGVSGFLVDRENASEAAEKLQLLIENETLRRDMGQAGRDIVAQKFDLTANVAQLVELYEW